MVQYQCLKMVQGVSNLRKQIALGNTPYASAKADGEHRNAGETSRVRENYKLRSEPEERRPDELTT